MTYRVLLTPAARRQVDRLHSVALVAVRGVILELGTEPRPPGVVKLVGSDDLWRLRIRVDGVSWRIVYKVDDAVRQVIVTRVVRRDERTHRSLSG